MSQINCTKEQLQLIQTALDLYSRVGIGQLTEIKDHPTFEKSIYNQCTPKKELEVGDQTMRGEIVKITKKYIYTKGRWSGKEEIKKWSDKENIKLSPDWNKYHDLRDKIDQELNITRALLYGEYMPVNGSWGIYNPKVDDSCREAYNMIQVIRYELNKASDNPCEHCVSSSVDSWIKNKITVEI